MSSDAPTQRITCIQVKVEDATGKRTATIGDGSTRTFESEAKMEAWLDGEYGRGNWLLEPSK